MQQNRGGEQKSYKLLGLFSLFIFLALPSFLWGSFEDFKRQQNSSFAEYKDQRDREFKNYLLQEWSEYVTQEGASLYEKPKPKSIDPLTKKSIKSVGPLIKIKLPQEDEKRVAQMPDTPLVSDKKDIFFDFFGVKLGFDIDKNIQKASYHPNSQKGVANFFEQVASSEYDDLLRSLKKISEVLELNDWGVYLLVSALADNVFELQNSAKLFKWFLLNKLGYDVKIALLNNHIVLMHYSEKIIYSTPRLELEKRSYYILSEYAKSTNLNTRVQTYKQAYPDAIKPLDLSLSRVPKFPNNQQKKRLTFTYNAKEYEINFGYNQNLIDFMATYPQADYETYFNAPMQVETYADVAREIKGYVDSMQASVALNFVLSFVQNAFGYQRDQEQFSREKVMFAQETLVYDKSDCEDRATLFSYLVKELFKIGVVGVKYSDHMATALYIPMKGDSVMVGSKRYLIADPTYLNATIGQSMPKYQSKTPQSLIVLKREGL